MAYVTQRLDEDFETLTAAADLDGQGSWAKMAGSGTADLFVIANATLGGAQAIAVRNAAAGLIGYEKSIGVTRVSGTDLWIVTWKVRINSGATDGETFWLTLSAGAGSLYNGVDGNNALAIGFRKVTGNVFIRYADDSSAGFQELSAAVGEDDTTLRLMLTINPDDVYSLSLDANDDGQGWVPLRSGRLKSGNEAISRASWQASVPASADDTILADNLWLTSYDDLVKVSFEDTPAKRIAKIVSSGAEENGDNTDITVDVYDVLTGEVVNSGMVVSMPTADLLSSDAPVRVDRAIQRALTRWEGANRVVTLAASAHETLL